MVKNIDRGLLVTRFSGGSPSDNGDFSGIAKNSFYIQNGSEPWSGIYIYSSGGLVSMGDSVIVSGEVSEFCWDGSSPCNCSSCGGAGQVRMQEGFFQIIY